MYDIAEIMNAGVRKCLGLNLEKNCIPVDQKASNCSY